MKLDLNCDLGEGEPLSQTRALMRWITSANVACGGHAGDVRSMQRCVQLARAGGVRLGAHPGVWSRGDFGRSAGTITSAELELLLVQQVGALQTIARIGGVRLHHIKLHGALYHACEGDPPLSRAYVKAVSQWWPQCLVYARAGGAVAGAARRAGVKVWEEVFADRAYQDNGMLVSRSDPRALLTGAGEVLQRFELLRDHGEVESVSGRRVPLAAQTLCMHSDSPGALHRARMLRQAIAGTARG
jgi:5-oxoprolinase (ATP-hydrolysing) subunit A